MHPNKNRKKMSNNSIDMVFVVPALKARIKDESIGTLILAKKAILAGFNVKIVRYWDSEYSPKVAYDKFKDSLVTKILSYNPKIVSFYCRCEEYHICLDLSMTIKDKDDKIIIAYGGPQSELVAKETISRFSFVDYVCCSEGENTIVPFLKLLLKNDDTISISSVDGLTYRNNEGFIVQNKFPEFLKDNYCREYYYYDIIPEKCFEVCESMPVDVGRGCPFSCTYCSTKTFWKRKFRLRNIKDTVDEMCYVSEKYGINNFDFMHDLFTVNKKRIIEFCAEIQSRGINVRWGCDSRIDTIDFELIDMMIANGLYRIFFGIETGSERMQQAINKKLNLERCDEIVKYCIDKGLEVTTSFIYGFPDETAEDLSQTISMAVRFQNYGCTVLTNMCHIMNGTELFNRDRDCLTINKTTAYNDCILAFNHLYPLISCNKDMFANFCDFPNPLRDEMKFLDVFRYTLYFAKNHFEEEHRFLLKNNYASIEMYRTFCKANSDVFFKLIPPSDGNVSNIKHLLKHDTPKRVYKLMINNLITAYK